MITHKEYLGDSVYADFDGYHVILTTENGMGASNRIALEGAVIAALNNYVQRLKTPTRPATAAEQEKV